MGKGKAPTNTTQTVTQDVPAFLKPYYTDVMSKSKALSEEAYSPFGGQRLADDSADLGTSQQMIRNIAGQPIAGLAGAQGTLGGLGSLAGQLGRQQPGQFNAAEFGQTGVSPYAGFQATPGQEFAQFQAGQVSPFSDFQAGQVSPFSDFQAGQATPFSDFQEFGGAQQFGYDPTRQFDTATAAQYMDPFMQTVVGRQQDDAIEKFRQQQAGRDASAVQAGAFGGSRQAVQQGIAETGLMDQLGDIQATGSQRAFEQAQQQFERDRAAGMTTEQRRAEEAARVQGIGLGESARVQQSQAQEMARTQGISVDEAARVQAAQAQEMARVQGISVDEAARVQQSQAQEMARVQGISVDEAARVQAAQAQEMARVQGISVEEAARVQQGQAQEMARTQGISVEEAARVQAAQASEAARVQQSSADEAMRQREFQLQTMGFSADMAREVAALGERARQGDIQAAQLLEAQGLGEMARGQARLDVGYEDFLRQQNFPRQQLADYSATLRGMPVADIGATTTTAPGPSAMQQALGAGISAVGLYKGMQ
jgi:hypothetical protein